MDDDEDLPVAAVGAEVKMTEVIERVARGAVAQRIADEIRRDHPDWTWLKVAREARREAGLPELGAEWRR